MITSGMTGTFKVTVSNENTAKTMKSGSLDVFATPSLVAIMEAAAVDAVRDELSENETTVGCAISVSHLCPTVVGDSVVATAEVKEVLGRRIVYKIKAEDSISVIGEGEHTRVIVDKEKFMDKAKIRREGNAE